VIADPNSTQTTQSRASTSSAEVVDFSPLTPDELYQLTLYKWRYALEADGFNASEVRELMFLKWLHASRRVLP
jgi:hypothetical protein